MRRSRGIGGSQEVNPRHESLHGEIAVRLGHHRHTLLHPVTAHPGGENHHMGRLRSFDGDPARYGAGSTQPAWERTQQGRAGNVIERRFGKRSKGEGHDRRVPAGIGKGIESPRGVSEGGRMVEGQTVSELVDQRGQMVNVSCENVRHHHGGKPDIALFHLPHAVHKSHPWLCLSQNPGGDLHGNRVVSVADKALHPVHSGNFPANIGGFEVRPGGEPPGEDGERLFRGRERRRSLLSLGHPSRSPPRLGGDDPFERLAGSPNGRVPAHRGLGRKVVLVHIHVVGDEPVAVGSSAGEKESGEHEGRNDSRRPPTVLHPDGE